MSLSTRIFLSCLALLGSTHALAANGVVDLPGHTIFFVGLAVLATAYFAVIQFDRFAVAHGPEILTTVGIFGCFYGVSHGLWAFDPKNVGASVPVLLEGIRTAFWASLFGIGGALVIKARHTFTKAPIPQSSDAPKAGSLDDLIAAAQRVEKAVVGQDEGTILTQLKLMRQDQHDGLRRLTESFDSFATKMAENNSKALVEALREVIRDFNTKINEQFGDNFKQLNAAVEKLVVWQQQYKEELDAIKTSQQQAAADMRIASTAFADVVTRAGAFAETATRLASLIENLEVQLTRQLEIEKSLHDGLNSLKDVAPTFSTKAAAMLDDLNRGVTKMQGEMDALVKAITASLQASHADMKRLLTDSMSTAHSQVLQHIKSLSEETNQQVLALDKALSTELTKSLETLGQQLTALSRKFVDDYTPLTDKLREVVQIARRMN